MSVWNVALGMNVKDNPLVFSPYTQGESNSDYPSPSSAKNLLTEGGVFILTEGAQFILTE